MYFRFGMCLLALQLGCAHTSQTSIVSNDNVNFDPKLVLAWSKAMKDTSTAKSPALYEFKHLDRTLLYLASQHSNRKDAPAFKLISWVFQNKPVDAIVVEGFEADLGISPESISKVMKSATTDGFYPDGEPSFAIENAKSRRIPWIGGEPARETIFKRITERGYSAQDLFNFEFIRRLPQMKRSGELKNKDLSRVYVEDIKSRAQVNGYRGKLSSFDEFKHWYKSKQGKEFTESSGEQGEAAPIDDGPFFTQKISLEVTRIRDENILSTISKMMNQHRNVLVIYGSSHYRIQHEAIKAALGPSSELNPRDP